MELAALAAKLFLLVSSIVSPQQQQQQQHQHENLCDSSAIEHLPVKPYTILVEGNVGCGKTTTLEFFSNRTDVDIVFEPVEAWQNVSGVDLLQKMADNADRYGGEFQIYSSLTRYRNDLKPTPKSLRLMERSIFSERYCFLEAAHKSRHVPGGRGISDPEYFLMDRWFQLLSKKLWHRVKPDLILYVRCDVSVVEERIKKRGRAEEAHIPRPFLEDIHKRHDDWLLYKNSTFPANARVVVLDGNLPMDEYRKLLKKMEREILMGYE